MIAHYHFCSPRLIPDIREIFSKINPRKSNLMVVVLVHGWMISTLSNYVWLICKNKVKEYVWLSSVEFVSFPVVNTKNGLLAIMAHRTCSKLNKICQIALLFSNIIGLTYRVSISHVIKMHTKEDSRPIIMLTQNIMRTRKVFLNHN